MTGDGGDDRSSETQKISEARQDDRTHRRSGQGLFERGSEILKGDDGPGPRVLELEGELRGRVQGVAIDGDESAAQDAE